MTSMKTFNEIDGWFSHHDCRVYAFLIENSPEDASFVEVGSWLGKSVSFLLDNKKATQTVTCVDTWAGSVNEVATAHKLATQTDIFEIFKQNLGNRDYTAIRLPSVEAAEQFEDGSLDAVFIDAEHTYEAVKADIAAWRPKIKKGGYLAGHDYSGAWPGVVRAVNESFGQQLISPGSFGQCWLVKL